VALNRSIHDSPASTLTLWQSDGPSFWPLEISVTALVLWLFTFQLSTGPKADHAPESSIDLQLMQKKPQ